MKALQAYRGQDVADRLLDMQAMHYVTKHSECDIDFNGLQNRVKRVREALAAHEI